MREKVAILPRVSIPIHRSLVETVVFPDLFLSPFSTWISPKDLDGNRQQL